MNSWSFTFFWFLHWIGGSQLSWWPTSWLCAEVLPFLWFCCITAAPFHLVEFSAPAACYHPSYWLKTWRCCCWFSSVGRCFVCPSSHQHVDCSICWQSCDGAFTSTGLLQCYSDGELGFFACLLPLDGDSAAGGFSSMFRFTVLVGVGVWSTQIRFQVHLLSWCCYSWCYLVWAVTISLLWFLLLLGCSIQSLTLLAGLVLPIFCW